MNENMKTTIVQKLEDLTDESGRQLLDYIEFLESKFNRSTRERTPLERLAENVEGTLRSSRIGEAAFKGTGGIIDAAGSVARGVAAAGQAVFDELQQVVGDDAEEKTEAGESGESVKPEASTEENNEEANAPKKDQGSSTEAEAGGEKASA